MVVKPKNMSYDTPQLAVALTEKNNKNNIYIYIYINIYIYIYTYTYIYIYIYINNVIGCADSYGPATAGRGFKCII